VSAPTRVASHDQAAAGVDRGAGDGSPGPTSTGTGSPVSIDGVDAEVPSTTTPSVAIFSPGRTTNSVADGQLVDRDLAFLAAVAQHGDVLGAEVEQGPQRRAGPALGPRLEVAAGEDERGDRRRDLEVDVARRPSGARRGQVEGIVMPGMPASPRTGVERPAERGERADRDERVHGGGAVAQVEPGGPVERPGAPHDDGGGQRERQPLPVGELQRRDHRHRDDRHGQRGETSRRVRSGGSGRRCAHPRGARGRRPAAGAGWVAV
jgi:hypothetical protein